MVLANGERTGASIEIPADIILLSGVMGEGGAGSRSTPFLAELQAMLKFLGLVLPSKRIVLASEDSGVYIGINPLAGGREGIDLDKLHHTKMEFGKSFVELWPDRGVSKMADD